MNLTSSPAILDGWLTRREAAEYLRVGQSTLAKALMTGDGPPVAKLGRSVRYRRADLDAWMAARMRQSTRECVQ